jgi:hypothetical protein
MMLDMLAAVAARIMTIGGAGRRKAKPRRRRRGATRGARKMHSAMTGSPACSTLGSLGDQSSARLVAAAPPSRRLPSASNNKPPEATAARPYSALPRRADFPTHSVRTHQGCLIHSKEFEKHAPVREPSTPRTIAPIGMGS